MKKKAIWVLENINKQAKYYSSLNILILISSITNWKKHHDTFNELYVDVMTYKFLNDLGVLHYWDYVNCSTLEEECKINKYSFWSSSKLRVLKEQEEPVILVDYDFIAYANVLGVDPESAVVYCYDEYGEGAYPDATDKYIKQLKFSPPYLKWCKNHNAINVCFLEFNDLSFQKDYAHHSLLMMEELSEVNTPKGIYVCYAEQLVLKQMLLEYGLKHRALISNLYDAIRSEFFTDRFNGSGLWTFEKSKLKFYHVGIDKPLIKEGDQTFDHLVKSVKNNISAETLELILKLSSKSLNQTLS